MENKMSATHLLSEIISENVSLNLVEPDIYSVYSIGDSPGSYDNDLRRSSLQSVL